MLDKNEEKQIEEMARTLCGEKEKSCEECDSRDICEFWVEASVLYHAGYRKQSGWISVEDALPQSEAERVLVSLKDANITKPLGLNKIDTDRYIDGKWVRWGRYVTHWMPLPEPQKMKGGERYAEIY